MLVEHSIHDAITEPIPILDKTEFDKSKRFVDAIKGISIIALGGSLCVGLGAGGTLAILNAPSYIENTEAAQATTWQNNQVSTIISELSGTELRVDCNDERIDESSDQSNVDAGYITYGQVRPYYLAVGEVSPPAMTVRESVCDAVINYNPELLPSDVDSDEFAEQYSGALEYAKSISVLLHEAEHNNQIHEEDIATCYSFQKLPGALTQLGMADEAATVVAQTTSLSLGSRLLPHYLSDECTPGGELDLAISDVYIGNSTLGMVPSKTIGVEPLKKTDELG